MIDHHYDDTEQVEVAAGEKGSDNNMTGSQGFRKKVEYGSLTYGRFSLSGLHNNSDKPNSARDFVGLRHGTVITSPRRSVRAQN